MYRSANSAAQRGFSLLELLVALVIIALIASVAVINLGDNRQREGKQIAQRLQLVMERMCERAEIEGRLLGIYVEAKGYAVLAPRTLTPKAGEAIEWLPMDSAEFAAHELAEGWQLSLLDGQQQRQSDRRGSNSEPAPPAPQLICLRAQTWPVFSIRLEDTLANDNSATHRFSIQPNRLGKLEISP